MIFDKKILPPAWNKFDIQLNKEVKNDTELKSIIKELVKQRNQKYIGYKKLSNKEVRVVSGYKQFKYSKDDLNKILRTLDL
jgi:hypothetical protein